MCTKKGWKIEVHIRDNYTCQHCGAKEDPNHLTFQVHHVVFKCQGGSSNLDNLLLTCPFCHRHFYHGEGYPRGRKCETNRKRRRRGHRRR